VNDRCATNPVARDGSSIAGWRRIYQAAITALLIQVICAGRFREIRQVVEYKRKKAESEVN